MPHDSAPPPGAPPACRFFPQREAVGVNIDVKTPHLCDIFVNVQGSNWPTPESARWSTVTARADAKSIIILDDDFVLDYYLIAVVSYTDGGEFSVQATDVFDLQSGVVAYGRVPSNGVSYYRFKANDADTVVSVLLDSFDGDADLLVSRQPFPKRPYFDASVPVCPTCLCQSYRPGFRDEVTITHLAPSFGATFWIAIAGWDA